MAHGIHFIHKSNKDNKSNSAKTNNKRNKTKYNRIKHNKNIDNITTIVAILMPFTTIPQIYKIWILQNTSGVSIWTWILYFILCIPMIIYGVFYKMTPIIILNALWMLMNLIIIVGMLIY